MKPWHECLTTRGLIVFVIIPTLLAIIAFTYATRDTCYVGQTDGNWLGYGSCYKMIDKVVGK